MATVTNAPRLLRAAAAAGVKGGKIPHGGGMTPHNTQAKGGAGRSAGGATGGGSASNPMGPFDSEGGTYDSADATTRWGSIGPFSWGGELTEGAKRVRQKMMDQNTALQGHMDTIQKALQANGGDMRAALIDTLKTNPGALNALAAGGMLSKNGIGSLLEKKGQDKLVYNPITNQAINLSEAKATDIAGGAPATPGSISIDPKTGLTIETPGSRSSAAPHATLPGGAANTPIGQRKTESEINKNEAETGKILNPPLKILTPQDKTALTGIDMILSNVARARAAVEASGSFGWGHLAHFAAEHTPLPVEDARTYDQAYKDMRAGISMLPAGSKIRSVAEAQFDRLPHPGDAEASNAHQAINDLGLHTRILLGDMTRNLQQGGVESGTAVAMAKTYEANPGMTDVLRDSMAKLNEAPGRMTDDQVAPLLYEAEKGRLPYDMATAVLRQAYQRKMISKPDFEKAAAAMPDLNHIDPREIVQDPQGPAADPAQTGQPAPQNIPTTPGGSGPPAPMPGGQTTAGPTPPATPAPPQGPQPIGAAQTNAAPSPYIGGQYAAMGGTTQDTTPIEPEEKDDE